MESSLDALTHLTKLVHLDLSQCNEPRGRFQDPDLFLERLAANLPKLRSLDISGETQKTLEHLHSGNI